MLDHIHLLLTAALVGFIWVVQLVVYPAFRLVDASNWSDYHRHHTRQISWIAMPLMLAELALSGYLCYQSFDRFHLTAFILIVLIWAVTFFAAVPIHGRLSAKKDLVLIRRLISVNAVRTALWSIKFILLFCALY